MREALRGFKMRKNKERASGGAALLTVLVALMIISLMLFEFQYTTMVERKLAYNEWNALQADYLARSGVQIGLLRVSLFGRILMNPQVKQMAGNMPLTQYLNLLWTLPLPTLPPDRGSLKKMDKKDKDSATKLLSQTRIERGISSHVITSESGKINLNGLIVPPIVNTSTPGAAPSSASSLAAMGPTLNTQPTQLYQYIGRILINLIQSVIQESPRGGEEFGGVRPDELVYHIMDWVNPGDMSFLGGSKDGYYQRQTPPYRAKRNRFYSLDELKMVQGMNDRLYEKLKPYITVVPYDARIDINFASARVLLALSPDLTQEDVKQIQDQATQVGGWSSVSQFLSYVNTSMPHPQFMQTYAQGASSGSTGGAASAAPASPTSSSSSSTSSSATSGKNNDFPLVTTSYGFIVEGMGEIEGSANARRLTRAGVALASAPGGQIDLQNPTQQMCQAAGTSRFWDLRFGVCRYVPTTYDQCKFGLGGDWLPGTPTAASSSASTSSPSTSGAAPSAPPPTPSPPPSSGAATTYCCYLNLIPNPVCPPIQSITGTVQLNPDALKITTWEQLP